MLEMLWEMCSTRVFFSNRLQMSPTCLGMTVTLVWVGPSGGYFETLPIAVIPSVALGPEV